MSLQPSPLPDWMFYVLQNQKRRQAYNTADRSPFMVDGQRCSGKGMGEECNKAECLSPGMSLQQLGGGRREREGRSDTNISQCMCTVWITCPDAYVFVL